MAFQETQDRQLRRCTKLSFGKVVRHVGMMSAVAWGLGLGGEGKGGASATDIASALSETQARNTFHLPRSPFERHSIFDREPENYVSAAPARSLVRRVIETRSRFNEEEAKNFAQQFNTLKILSGTAFVEGKRRKRFTAKQALLGTLAIAFLMNTCAPVVTPTAIATEIASIPGEMTPTIVEPTPMQPAEIPINPTVFPPETAPTPVSFPAPPDFSSPPFLSEIFSPSAQWVSGVVPTGALEQNYLENYKQLFDQMGVQLARVFEFGGRNTTVGFNNIGGRWYMTCVSAGDILSFRCDTRQPGWFLKPPQETPRYVWVGLPIGATPDSVKVRGYNTEYPIYAITDAQGAPTSVLQGGTTAKGFTARSEFALPATAVPTEAPVVLQDKVEIVDEASVPTEVVTAFKSLNLEMAKDLRWGQNAEWGRVLVDKEGRIKFVDYPMTFSLDGKETVVHMPMYFSQTSGEGNMVVMTALRASDETKVGRAITGTDAMAREFYAWLLEYYKDREGTEFYENLQKAANGQLDAEFIRADLNLIPKDWLAKRQTNVVRMNGASLKYIMKDGQDVVHVVTIEPHISHGKLIFIDFSDISLTANAENPDTFLTSESWIGGVVARSLGDLDGLAILNQLVQQELERLKLLIDKVVVE